MNSCYVEFANIEASVRMNDRSKFVEEIGSIRVAMKEIVIKEMKLFQWLVGLDVYQYRIVDYVEIVEEESRRRDCVGFREEVREMIDEVGGKMRMSALQAAVGGGKFVMFM